MLVSVIIPACAAQPSIGRAVRSVFAQTVSDWEAIIVADDAADYAAVLRDQGLRDERLRFVSTGRVRSGCHNARNVGLVAAHGDLIAALDADDLFRPSRLEILVPLALEYGAAVDNSAVISEETGDALARSLGPHPPARIEMEDFLALNVPLFPVIRRDHAEPRLPGIEFAEDVVANLRLIDRLGFFPAVPDILSEYHVVTGSLCHADDSAATFDRVYGELLERVRHGDGLGLSTPSRAIALAGLTRKRAFNRAFGEALRDHPALNFQTFAASRSSAVPLA
jgi:succinoglycan biosynthesis protein ExoO